MPIGGGVFTVQNKELPGSYINFVNQATAVLSSDRGTATFALELPWGTDDAMITMEAADFTNTALKVFGYGFDAPELLLLREAFKRARTLKVYKANTGGTKASGSVGGITVTARCKGLRGNDIKIAVQTNVDEGSKKDVLTYLGGMPVDSQTVSAASELKANDYVTFGAGTLATAAATPLSGGTNGSATGASHAAYLSAVEVEEFQVIGYPGTDETTKALYAGFVKRLREEDGKKITGVLYDYAADYEGLINVKNGVKLADGTVISGDKAVAWVTGASAAATKSQSLTNTAYEGAVDADIRYTTRQYEAAVRAGELVFYGEGGRARVLTDINSLTTFTKEKSEAFSGNRVIRVLDAWANDVAALFGRSYIGLVTNNGLGRDLFKGDLVSLAMEYQAAEAISNFSSDDIVVIQGIGKRDVSVTCALMPNDSMEKLYMTVSVQ